MPTDEDEEVAKAHYAWMRQRYLNIPTPWDQLTDDQKAWLVAWVRLLREQGFLPTRR
jgi:hypothetical protein